MSAPGDIPLTPLDEFTLSVRGVTHCCGVYAGSAAGYWLVVVQSGRLETTEYKLPPGRKEKVITYGPDPCGYGVYTKKRGMWWVDLPMPAVQMVALVAMRKWASER